MRRTLVVLALFSLSLVASDSSVEAQCLASLPRLASDSAESLSCYAGLTTSARPVAAVSSATQSAAGLTASARFGGVAAALLAGTADLTTPTPAPASSRAYANRLGINIGAPLYYDASLVYADAAKQGGYGTAAVDSNGWPTGTSFTQYLWANVRGTQGTYTVYFDGTASLTVNGVASTTCGSPTIYSGNTRTCTFEITATGATQPTIAFSNAHRPDGSNGLVNIKVMRPTTQGGTTSDPPTQLLSSALKGQIKRGFKVVRFMDFQATNWSQITTWGGRPWQPSHAYQVGDVVTMKISGSQDVYGNGRAYRCTVAGTSASGASSGPNTATWGGTVTDGSVTWQHIGWGRPLPTWNGFDNNASDGAGSEASAGAAFGWQGMGGPFEHIILFANELAAEGYPIDVWVQVHHQADDDYITKMAQVFAFGSDGAMPYTSTQQSPVYPPLNSQSNIYVEYSNEVWMSGSFSQAPWAEAHATADGVLDYDGDTSVLRYRLVGRQLVKAANAFRAAFGDAAMAAGRVRPVIMGQIGWWDVSDAPALKFIHEYYGNGDGIAHVATPHPVSWFVWGVGGAPYLDPSDTSSVAGMLTTGGMATSSLRTAITGQARLAAAFGVRLIAYEGGPEFPVTVTAAQANMTDQPGTPGALLTGTPNMRTQMIALHEQWREMGGDLWTYFTDAQNGGPQDWNFAGEDIGSAGSVDVWATNSPKLNAMADLATATPVAVSLGATGLPQPAYAVPTDATGTSAPGGGYVIDWPGQNWTEVGSGSGSRSMTPSAHDLAGYVFLPARPSTDGTVSVTLSGVAAGARASVALNGTTIGQTTTSANGTFTFGGQSVNEGLNGVLVSPVGGAITVDNVRLVAPWTTLPVTRARIYPRAGHEAVLAEATIEGSNTSSTTGYTTLATLSGAPAAGQWTELSISSATAYRWLKLNIPSGAVGSVAEVAWYDGGVQITGAGFGTPGTTGHDYSYALDGDTSTYYEGTGTVSNYVGLDQADGHVVATPEFDPAAGSYGTAQSVTISTATSSATIRYTTDGTDPATSGTAQTYSAPVSISSTATLRAIATATGYYPSAEQTGLYTIGGAAPSQSVFFLGNSLTDSVLNGNFLVLIAAAGGKTLTQNYFTGAGAGTYIYWYTSGGSGGSVPPSPQAWVQAHAVDGIVSQPAANMPCLPSGHANDTSDHGNWSDGANIQITWEDEHALNAGAIMWIHETWLAPPTPTGQGFQSNCFVGGWNRDPAIWNPAAPTNDWDASMDVYRQYNEAVRTALINAHPTWTTPWILPSGVGLKNLKDAVAAGSIPGWGTGEFWSRVFDAGNPPDHLTPEGRYFVSLIFYASIFQSDPRTLADTNLGTTATLTAGQAAALQSIAYDTVSGYAYSGWAR